MRKIHKLWIVGASSKIGKELIKQIDPMVINLIATDIDDVDITKIDEALSFSYLNVPDAIINAYELSDAKECEDDYKKAFKINTLAARNLAICSRKIGARFVQLSTDLVFESNEDNKFNEFDTPTPKSIYSITKYEGERFVRELAQKYFIIRTSYLYDKESDFNDVCALYKNRQIAPTSTSELAKFIIMLMNTPEYGIYHASDAGYCTVNEFIKEINNISNSDLKTNQERGSNIKIELEELMLNISDLYKFPKWKDDLINTIR